MEKTKEYTSPYEMDGRIPWPKAIVYGLQHVLAMFVGNLTPLIVICGACGIGAASDFAEVYVELLQNAMIIAGVVTLVQLFAIGPVGGRVPIIMGTSSGFIGVFKSVAGVMGGGVIAYGAIMGASIIGGLFEGVLGFFLKPLRRFFPAVVTGTVVLSIGLSLISVGVSSFGGGSSAADYGSLENLFIGLVVLIIILGVKHFAKGMASSSSILIGIIAGYVLCFIMGMILPTTAVNADGVEYTKAWVLNFDKVREASWFALPKVMPVKPIFDMRAIVPVLIMFIVTAVETIGDISGVMEGGLGREATDKELSGGVMCDGLGSSLAALFGVLPNTSFSQNVGLVTMTKVVNRMALACGAGVLILCGLFPKLAALISIMPQSVLGGAAVMMFSSIVVSFSQNVGLVTMTKVVNRMALACGAGVLILCGLFPKLAALISIMPQSVLGGAAVMMFSSIVVSGIQLITKEKLTGRNITIVSVALGLGYGLGANSDILRMLPDTMQLIFGGSGIVPAAIVALVLNIVLPKDEA